MSYLKSFFLRFITLKHFFLLLKQNCDQTGFWEMCCIKDSFPNNTGFMSKLPKTIISSISLVLPEYEKHVKQDLTSDPSTDTRGKKETSQTSVSCFFNSKQTHWSYGVQTTAVPRAMCQCGLHT